MGNAQDQALLALATRQGLLASGRAARLRQLHRELGHKVPLAHLLLNGQLLSSSKVAALLRELASGTFVCVRCAERLPYFGLAALEDARCPLCAGELHYYPHPRDRAPGAGGIPLLEILAGDPQEDTAAQCSDHLGRWSTSPTPSGARRMEVTPARGGLELAEPTLVDGLQETPTRGWPEVLPLGQPPSELAPLNPFGPARLGEWELQEVLGRGGSGVVYRVRHLRGGQEAALKLLRSDLSESGDVARFHLEAQVARRLRHPGIIPVFEVGVSDGHYYYLMELCRGETLQQRLKRTGPLLWRAAAVLVAGLCDAVSFAHEHGFIHRDLKPANVLIDPRDGRARVTDFGLARERDHGHGLTRTGELLGTPGYMAPEQFLGERVDERTDVHALGAILYECLTGIRPWMAPTVILLAELIVHQDARPPSERRQSIPPALDALVLRALHKDPLARFASAREMAAALRALAGV